MRNLTFIEPRKKGEEEETTRTGKRVGTAKHKVLAKKRNILVRVFGYFRPAKEN